MFCLVFLNIGSQAQDVTKLIFSKMDMAPQYELWDGNSTLLMGFTELMSTPISLPAPTLIFNEGDSVELKLRNMSQAAPHTIHLHGLDVDQQNDGVPHLSFVVEHTETRSYHFKAPHPGTYIYHCHVFSSLHVQAGMYGLLIVKPSDGSNNTWTGGYAFDKEYAWLMSEIDVNWHEDSIINETYDTSAMMHFIPEYHPQYFLVNGKSEQQLSDTSLAIHAETNQKIYLRLANIGNYGNRIIFPSALNVEIVSTDGRPLPTIEESDTVVVTPGERYGVMLNPTSDFNDSIFIEYFNLNTQEVENTQAVVVSISNPFRISEEDDKASLSVYPNPADDYLVINNENPGKLSIFDATGKYVLFDLLTSKTAFSINTQNWSNGIYLIRFDTGDNSSSKKIFITH